MEMRYWWLLDAEAQDIFTFHYHPGLENLGDYPSKHHTADVHCHVRPYYVHQDNSPSYLPRAMKPSSRRGCAEILGDPYTKNSSSSSCSSSRLKMNLLINPYTYTHFIHHNCPQRHHHSAGSSTCPHTPATSCCSLDSRT